MVSIIEFWNETAGKQAKVRFRPRMYERHSVATSGEAGQTVINRQLVEESQACVAFFHGKVGYKTDNHESGTAEEIAVCTEMGLKPGIHFWDGFVSDGGKEDTRFADYKKLIGDHPEKYYYQRFTTPIEAVTKAMRSVLLQANELDGISLDEVVDTTQTITDPETNEGISFTDFYENSIVADYIAQEFKKFGERRDEGAAADWTFAINDIRDGWVLTNDTTLSLKIHSYEIHTIAGADENYYAEHFPVVAEANPFLVLPGEEFDPEIEQWDEDILRRSLIKLDYTVGNHRIEGTIHVFLDPEAEDNVDFDNYMERKMADD